MRNLANGFLKHRCHLLLEVVNLTELFHPITHVITTAKIAVFARLDILMPALSDMMSYLEVLVSDMMGYLEVLTPTETFPLTSLTNTERIARAKSARLEKYFKTKNH